jgi:hypothetical protein
MSAPLSDKQFDLHPKITGGRHAYGTTTVHTEPHEREPRHARVKNIVVAYHWHEGDHPMYIEAEGVNVKKDGTMGSRTINDLLQPPPHVMDEMHRLRAEANG